MSLFLQYLVIGLMVLGSLMFMLRKFVPQFGLRWQMAWAAGLGKPSHPAIVRALGRWMQPAQGEGGCGSGCNTCNSCSAGQNEPTSSSERPLTFYPRRNS